MSTTVSELHRTLESLRNVYRDIIHILYTAAYMLKTTSVSRRPQYMPSEFGKNSTKYLAVQCGGYFLLHKRTGYTTTSMQRIASERSSPLAEAAGQLDSAGVVMGPSCTSTPLLGRQSFPIVRSSESAPQQLLELTFFFCIMMARRLNA